MDAQGRQHPPGNALPSISSLTNGMPPASQPSPHSLHNQIHPARDSGAWVNSQSSKHTSANSNLHVSTLLNPDEGQPRGSMPSTPTSTRLSGPGQMLPSISQGSVQRDSYASHGTHESRRSSIDSRVHSGISGLAINSSQPYESQHASQVSLAASLRRPETQTQLSPIASRTTPRVHDHTSASRVAPPIVPNPRFYGAPDPTAVKPTQGFPWAFPDSAGPAGPDDRRKRRASSSESSTTQSQKMSRQNSFAASSVRSSALSGEGPMPAGQRRFEEGMGFQKIIGPAPTDVASDNSPSQSGLIQHRSVTQLQSEHSTNGSVPGGYARTPELRVSHKLAERKRRSEMKDLFEELNKAVPANAGAKASKWEILSKAIDHIRVQRDNERLLHEEMNRLRIEVERMHDIRSENEKLRIENSVLQDRTRRQDGPEGPAYPQYSSPLAQPQHRAPHHSTIPGGLPSINSSHSHALAHQHPQQAYQSSSPHQHQQSSYYSQSSQGGHMQGVEYTLPTRPGYEGR